MPDNCRNLSIRIFPYVEDAHTYPMEIVLDDGSSYQDGTLRLDLPSLATHELDAQAYGKLLFEALFSGRMRSAYDRATALAEAQTGGRLRIRLEIDNQAVELHAVRWENLFHVRRGQLVPLAASIETPFSRYTPLEAAEPPPVLERPLKMLVAIANPLNLPGQRRPVDIEVELDSLQEALGNLREQNLIQVMVLPGRSGVSPERQRHLEAQGYRIAPGYTNLDNLMRYLPNVHIVHFLGHGAFQRPGERGPGRAALYLEREDGAWQAITDEEIVARLAPIGNLPYLVFLVACESASRDATAEHPFIGLAPKLVLAGVPAVIAMQGLMPIASARTLTNAFYRELLEHGEVDQALNQARLQILKRERTDWSIPVLFMRLKTGHLFARGVTPAVKQPAGPRPRFLVRVQRANPFVGREDDLQNLHQALHGAGSDGTLLTGQEGVGKTQLAVEYAHRSYFQTKTYPGGVYWVEANNWRAELAVIAERVGVPVDGTPGTDNYPRQIPWAFIDFLDAYQGALLIFDNVEDPQSLRKAVSDFFLTATNCRWLFITPQSDPVPQLRRVEIGALPRTHALELLLPPSTLRQLLPVYEAGYTVPELEMALDLCRLLGDSPFMLRLARAYLEQMPTPSLAAYRQRLVNVSGLTTPARTGMLSPPNEHDRVLGAVLQLQWEALTDDAARLAITLMALCGPEARVARSSVALWTALADEGPTPRLEAALERLRALALVEILAGREFRLPPAVHSFVLRQIADQRSLFLRTFESNVLEGLQKRESRFERALLVGENLAHWGWTVDRLRPIVIAVLSEALQNENYAEAVRRRVALVLTQLNWFNQIATISPVAVLAYLQFTVLMVDTPAQRRRLIEHISEVLARKMPRRLRAHLLAHRAKLRGQLYEFLDETARSLPEGGQIAEEVKQDYKQTQQIVLGLIDAENGRAEDRRLLARIFIGLANLANLGAEGLAPPDDQAPRWEAVKLDQQAAQLASDLGPDVELAVIALTNLSGDYASLKKWPQATQHYQHALEILERHADSLPDKDTYARLYFLIHNRGGLIHWSKAKKSNMSPAEALPEYARAHHLMLRAIQRLKRYVGESEDLALAYINAGDYLEEMYAFPEKKISRVLNTMRAHWQCAQTIARRRGIWNLERAAGARLASIANG